jgi:hypothetical protein
LSRQVPWPRIVAEGIAIVVSILLAFGIQAWWEERQERAMERALLTGLVEDLRRDSADYSSFATVQGYRLAGADFLLSRGGQEPSGTLVAGIAAEEMTPGRAFQLIGLFNRLETVRVSYDQITAAGISNVISDPELRRMIGQYYAEAEDRADVNDFNSTLSQQLRLSLRDYGYVTSDGDPVPHAILSDSAVLADIRSIRSAARSSAATGSEMLELALGLMHASMKYQR